MMKKIKIIRNGVETNQASGPADEMDAWLASCLSKNKFGKPERWVREGDEDVSAALETRQVELEPAVLDGEGNVVTPAVMVTEYKLAAQYTVVEENITNEVEQQRINQESLAYLASTDWYVIRLQETGVAIPQEVLDKRAAARAAIVK